jgi:hypothetical protein
MAGQFVTILNPGYSTLYTRDLGYTVVANVDGGASANPFNPDSTHPLQEGEWLTFDGTGKLKRAAANVAYDAASPAALSVAVSTAGGGNDLATTPCFLYFQERGRYDAQLTRKAHCITGPVGFEFRTKMIVCASGHAGERCFVQLCNDSSGRQVAALVSESAVGDGVTPASGDWYAGVIMQVHGTNDATVLFQPGYL